MDSAAGDMTNRPCNFRDLAASFVDPKKDFYVLMARILAISSYVAFGHVGLGAIVPALQALNHQVIAVPTVVLSNHYGYQNVGGFDVPIESFAAMTSGLEANGWLENVDGVITGYLPSVDFIECVKNWIGQLRDGDSELIYLCDPVVGDDPKGLYVAEDLAAAVRSELVPIADIVTPNRFELSWLTGTQVSDREQAWAAAEGLGGALVVATSVPAGEGLIANVLCNEKPASTVTRRRDAVPHGTGDLFAALLLGHVLAGRDTTEATARATAGVQVVIEASLGAEELRLMETIERAVAAEPVVVVRA